MTYYLPAPRQKPCDKCGKPEWRYLCRKPGEQHLCFDCRNKDAQRPKTAADWLKTQAEIEMEELRLWRKSNPNSYPAF